MLDQRDWHPRLADEGAANLVRRVLAAIVDENDFVPAVDGQPFDLTHHRSDGVGAVVERNDKAEGD